MKNIKSYVPEFAKNCYRWGRSHLWQLSTKGRIRKLIGGDRPIWLDIGSGPKHGESGWTTLDLSPMSDLCWDLRRKMPFPDNSIAQLYSSHLFEHLLPSELKALLAECKRVLIPNGMLSVAVPNAKLWIAAYMNGQPIDTWMQNPRPNGLLDLVNYVAYMDGCHKYLFDDEILLNVLRTAGFRNVQLRSFDPTIDVAARQHQSIYARCCK
jgi:predicted SAM-dependent methyltransferase